MVELIAVDQGNEFMKAAFSTRYGSPDVLEVREAPKPTAQENEVLVKVHATTVNRTDCGMLRGHPLFARLFIGLPKPKRNILGLDFAGEIEAVGAGVTLFKPGDRVFGMSPSRYGAHAEYICVPESGTITTLPENTPYQEAVLCEGAWYAGGILRGFGVKPGDKILIYGASGAIGIAALQLAKAEGAEVTAVVAARHAELVKSLGADHVIDYTAQDFTQVERVFDFVLDAVGKTTFFKCRKLLKPGGTFSATDLGPWGQNAWLAIWSSITRRKRVIFPLPTISKTFMSSVKAHMEAGRLRAVIDRIYPLDEIANAYRYVETEQKTGIVVISVIPDEEGGRI
jgi:NADPH:quinone reductase-like Zn-dependent oxidoreductase